MRSTSGAEKKANCLNETELQKLVETISLKYFHRPFRHHVRINHRLRTTGGRYNLRNHEIEINAHFLVEQYRSILIGIIKHELCHYHLHLLGRGYRHCDLDFKTLLQKVGGSRYTPDVGLYQRQKRRYLYRCSTCGMKYPRVRRLNLQRYRCGRCSGRLHLLATLD